MTGNLIAPGATVQSIFSGAIGTVIEPTVCPPGHVTVSFRIGRRDVTTNARTMDLLILKPASAALDAT